MEIIAHRGASYDAPENTFAAARLAWIQGADALECDVQLTGDGELVVLHDEDTGRVGNRKLVAAASTLAEIGAVDVGRWKGEHFAGEKPPTLAQLVATVPAGKRVFIEVKGGPECIEPLEAVLQRSTLAPAQTTIISFNVATAMEAKRRLREHAVCWLREWEDWTGTSPAKFGPGEDVSAAFLPWLDVVLGCCRAAHLDGVDLDHAFPLDIAAVRRIRDAGLKLYVWTVDDPIRAHALTDAGVDGITTNRPGWLREQLAKIRRERS